MAKEKVKKKSNKFCTFIFLVLLIITTIFTGAIYYLNVLPLKYFLLIVTGIVILICFFGLILLNKRVRKPIKGFFVILSIAMIAGMGVVSNYSLNAKQVINNITQKVDYKTENYSVVVKADAYSELEELDAQEVGYLDNGTKGTSKALKELIKKVETTNDDYDDVKKLSNDLLKENIQAILVEDSFKDILTEEDEDFKNDTEVLYSFSVKVPEVKASKKVDVTNEPFNIYLTGIDTYGKISSVSRSDVNIIASINPKTGQILLTSIPRDYYVELAGKDAYDKLTHAGIYGVDTSVKTIENLLDININYYVKVNFTSIVKIVDELDGVTVHSDYSFTSQDNYRYVKGDNVLNGKRALSFARERHAFAAGDVQRGKNQMYLIQGMADKLMQFSSVTKFNSLLDTIDGTFETNISSEEISKLIKMQIDKRINWNIESNYLDGTGASKSTYSSKSHAYVMEPDNTSIASAKTKISKVFNAEE